MRTMLTPTPIRPLSPDRAGFYASASRPPRHELRRESSRSRPGPLLDAAQDEAGIDDARRRARPRRSSRNSRRASARTRRGSAAAGCSSWSEQDAAGRSAADTPAAQALRISQPPQRAGSRGRRDPSGRAGARAAGPRRRRAAQGTSGRLPAGRLDRRRVVVDARHERAELDELDRLAAGATEQMEYAAPADAGQPLADPRRQPRRREHVLGRPVRVVEGAAVVIGRLHRCSVPRDGATVG